MLAIHYVLGYYGFWLPNDPRGSGSTYVGSKNLLPYGEATKVAGPKSVAKRPHDKQLRQTAKQSLALPPVRLTGTQARLVAHGFRDWLATETLPVHALAVMPDHAHLVLPPHARLSADSVAPRLKASATKSLAAAGLHPFQDVPTRDGSLHKLFGRGAWKVFLDDVEGVLDGIKYVEDNPSEIGYPKQVWSFVTPYIQREPR